MIEINVMLAWLLATCVFLGIGHIVRWVLWRENRILLMDVWLGWGCVIAFLQLWHLMLPVDWRAGSAVTSLGLAGLAFGLLTQTKRDILKRGSWYLGVGALIALWLAQHSTNQPANADTGLYHLNAVRWAKEYAIVPGLGNLHARLAFNQSYFLYVAMLDVGPFAHKSHQLASGLLILWALLRVTTSVRIAFRSGSHLHPSTLYDIILLVPVVAYTLYRGNISSPTPDVAVYILSTIMASEAIRILSVAADDERKTEAADLGTLAFLACLGITIKLSLVAVALALCGVILMYIHRKEGMKPTLRFVRIGLVAGVVLLTPWIARGYVLSGYPAYPVKLGRLNVDWCVPASNIERNQYLIRSWALSCGDTISETLVGSRRGYWLWLMKTVREEKGTFVVPLVLALLGWGCYLVVKDQGLERSSSSCGS